MQPLLRSFARLVLRSSCMPSNVRSGIRLSNIWVFHLVKPRLRSDLRSYRIRLREKRSLKHSQQVDPDQQSAAGGPRRTLPKSSLRLCFNAEGNQTRCYEQRVSERLSPCIRHRATDTPPSASAISCTCPPKPKSSCASGPERGGYRFALRLKYGTCNSSAAFRFVASPRLS
jgi:hypothetical protein